MGTLKRPSQIELDVVKTLTHSLKRHGRSFVQVLMGPRQVGKTTAAQMLLKKFSPRTSCYVTADAMLHRPAEWLVQQWAEARAQHPQGLLVIDEVQKIENWAEAVKHVWDAQHNSSKKMKLLLLGSSSMVLHKGLSESLAGRYQLHQMHHWNADESEKAYGLNFEEFLLYGGYPGSYPLIRSPHEWAAYIRQSIVDAVIGRDILAASKVSSPSLFKQCFELACAYPAQILSYNKLLGQLHTRGNTDKVKYYLELFEAAFLMKQVFKYSNSDLSVRNSSPKLLPLCPALYTSTLLKGQKTLQLSPDQRGRAFELLIGAALCRLPGQVFYWKQGNFEVDYIYQSSTYVYGIEVKSGAIKHTTGLLKFQNQFPQAKIVVLTPQNYKSFFKKMI